VPHQREWHFIIARQWPADLTLNQRLRATLLQNRIVRFSPPLFARRIAFEVNMAITRIRSGAIRRIRYNAPAAFAAVRRGKRGPRNKYPPEPISPAGEACGQNPAKSMERGTQTFPLSRYAERRPVQARQRTLAAMRCAVPEIHLRGLTDDHLPVCEGR